MDRIVQGDGIIYFDRKIYKHPSLAKRLKLNKKYVQIIQIIRNRKKGIRVFNMEGDIICETFHCLAACSVAVCVNVGR